VLLVAHYFGFYQNMQKLRSWCDAHRVIMIEDCAHAFFGDVNGHPVGWYGDYAIASARKFFALADGGYLVSARHPLHGVTTEPGGFAFDIKSVLNAVESAFAYGRLAPLSYALTPVLTLQAHLWEKLKAWRDAGVAPSTGPGVSVGYQYLDLASIRKRMSVPSRCLLRLSARSAIVARRRTHYQRLATGLSGLSGARPLFPDLPDGVVPYMFPLLVEQPDSVFPALKRKGVPIWRWEHLEPGDCAVSRNYAYALFQLPCHQALRGPEIDWMIDTISEMLASVVRRCLP
jgi:dTDP-4-amino-4,6-dideoxygalactose transaminase